MMCVWRLSLSFASRTVADISCAVHEHDLARRVGDAHSALCRELGRRHCLCAESRPEAVVAWRALTLDPTQMGAEWMMSMSGLFRA